MIHNIYIYDENMMGIGPPNWFTQGAAGEGCNEPDVTLLLLSDLSIIMIGPGGLLLVVSQLFAVPVLVLWVC